GGVGDEGEGLIAVEIRVSIDCGEVDLVLALGEVNDLIELVGAIDHDVLRFVDRGILEGVGALIADEIVAAEPAYQRVFAGTTDHAVVATHSIEKIVAGIALQVVVTPIAPHKIVAVAAKDAVVAPTAEQLVFATETGDRIITVKAIDEVGAGV